MKLKKNDLLLHLLLLYIIMLNYSCSESMIGAGLTKDRGNLATPSIDKPKTTTGVFVQYRWKNMIDYRGYGGDVNTYFKAYSEGILFQSLEAKYYYSFYHSKDKIIRLDLAAGLGFGYFMNKFHDQVPLVSSFGFDMHFPKNNLLYTTTKISYVRSFGDNTYNLGVEFGLGVRIRK